jgi:Protein of unknown function (DUF2845)
MKAAPLVLVLALAAAAPAYAFRCGTKLVTEGDTRSQVIAKCGEPTEVERRSTFREPVVIVGGRAFRGGLGLVEIPIEFWVYNLGPSKLMRRIRFEDGVVVEIETLGYGYIDSGRPAPREDIE